MAALNGFLVAQIIMLDRAHILIQFINQRNAGGNVQPGDLFFGNIIQVFHQRAQGITMRGDDHAFARFDGRNDGIDPIGQEPFNGIFQAFRAGHFIDGQVRITSVIDRVALIIAWSISGGGVS